eukprot:SAG31_NODE_1320_length_8809_cov_4.243398_8_plen_198_part_00
MEIFGFGNTDGNRTHICVIDVFSVSNNGLERVEIAVVARFVQRLDRHPRRSAASRVERRPGRHAGRWAGGVCVRGGSGGGGVTVWPRPNATGSFRTRRRRLDRPAPRPRPRSASSERTTQQLNPAVPRGASPSWRPQCPEYVYTKFSKSMVLLFKILMLNLVTTDVVLNIPKIIIINIRIRKTGTSVHSQLGMQRYR